MLDFLFVYPSISNGNAQRTAHLPYRLNLGRPETANSTQLGLPGQVQIVEVYARS